MSFGLGISFGRLCRRERSLQDIYDGAPRIGFLELKENPVDTNLELRAKMIRRLSETFKWRTYEKV